MKIKRKGSAVWRGGIRDGKGAISTESGALKDYPYGFASRFEGQPGSNPEELIAAAHASCFTMALSLILVEAKLTAQHMKPRLKSHWNKWMGVTPSLLST
jgi:osmotically inducible protein OsmC